MSPANWHPPLAAITPESAGGTRRDDALHKRPHFSLVGPPNDSDDRQWMIPGNGVRLGPGSWTCETICPAPGTRPPCQVSMRFWPLYNKHSEKTCHLFGFQEPPSRCRVQNTARSKLRYNSSKAFIPIFSVSSRVHRGPLSRSPYRLQRGSGRDWQMPKKSVETRFDHASRRGSLIVFPDRRGLCSITLPLRTFLES